MIISGALAQTVSEGVIFRWSISPTVREGAVKPLGSR